MASKLKAYPEMTVVYDILNTIKNFIAVSAILNQAKILTLAPKTYDRLVLKRGRVLLPLRSSGCGSL